MDQKPGTQLDRARDAAAAVATADFKRHLNRGQVRYLRAGHLDVVEGQRQGTYFVDALSGRTMLDSFCAAGCFSLGRRNPELIAVIEAAADQLDMGTFDLPSQPKLALAAQLIALAPGDLDRVMLLAGGGDTIDAAIKLARVATGRTEVLVAEGAYHGHTGLALSAMSNPHYRRYCEPLLRDCTFVPFNDGAAMQARASERTAAIIVEPIQGEGGIVVGTDEFLQGLRSLCDRLGIVLVFDEVQTGFARTGRVFACEHSGVVPDILAVAKALGGGLYPCAALLYRPASRLAEAVDRFPDMHPSVAGGSDIGCRVALRALEMIEEEDLCKRAEVRGARLQTALRELMRDNRWFVEAVRGRGLMVGIELSHEFMGPLMTDALARQGVFSAYCGNAPQVIRFMPPLTITEEELESLVVAIRDAIRTMRRGLPLSVAAARIPAVRRLFANEAFQTHLYGGVRSVEDLLARLRPGGPAGSPSRSEGSEELTDPRPEGDGPRHSTENAPAGTQGTTGREAVSDRASRELLASYAAVFGRGRLRRLESIGHDFFESSRAGSFVYDTRGRRFFDCRCGAGIYPLGRAHAELRAELRNAASEVDQGNFALISEEKARLARALADFTPGNLECTVFSVMRGETIELACKLARGATGRSELVSFEGSCHGETGFALSLEGSERFGPLIPDVRILPFGDIDAARTGITRNTAAVIVEPVQVENHCRQAGPDFLQALRCRCRETSAALVFDETQTAFGRTGRRFACDHSGLAPDMLVLGEALGGGLFPITATVFTQKLKRFLDRHPLIHLSTFGGHDVGCRVALRTLDLLHREHPWENAAELGPLFQRRLQALAGTGAIRSAAGLGLAHSLDLGDLEATRRFCRRAAANGVLVAPGRTAQHTVLVQPSLLISRAEAHELLDRLRQAAPE